MDCPVDGTTLQITDRQGVEIDYCPRCRGVWLDRGELDKLVERSEAWRPREDRHDRDERRDWDDRRDWDERVARKKKRGSFLSEIFEFGD